MDTDKTNPESSEHWRNNAEGLRKINDYALKNKILTDVIFKVGLETKEVHAHRLILSLASPVFEAMFYGCLAEKENVVTIPDVTPEGFQCLLTYIYTESCTFASADEAFETCLAAEKYCLPDLKRECELYMCTCLLSPESVWSFLDFALRLSLKAFTENCLHYLKRQTKRSIRTRAFLDASKEAILQLLALDTVDVSEIFLLERTVYWCKWQTSDESMIVEILYSLLKDIRFGSINPNEFCAFLEANGKFMNDSDALAILKHLTEPKTYSLPAWCCSKSSRIVRIVQELQYSDESDESESDGKNASNKERGYTMVYSRRRRPRKGSKRR